MSSGGERKQTAMKSRGRCVEPVQPNIGVHKRRNHRRCSGRSAAGCDLFCQKKKKKETSLASAGIQNAAVSSLCASANLFGCSGGAAVWCGTVCRCRVQYSCHYAKSQKSWFCSLQSKWHSEWSRERHHSAPCVCVCFSMFTSTGWPCCMHLGTVCPPWYCKNKQQKAANRLCLMLMIAQPAEITAWTVTVEGKWHNAVEIPTYFLLNFQLFFFFLLITTFESECLPFSAWLAPAPGSDFRPCSRKPNTFLENFRAKGAGEILGCSQR